MTPFVGQTLHYRPAKHEGDLNAGQPCAAVVLRVWSPNSINIVYWDLHGYQHFGSSVRFLLPEDEQPKDGWYCELIPETLPEALIVPIMAPQSCCGGPH